MGINAHITDEDLLQAVDGELTAAEATRVGSHMGGCGECRSRRTELERTIERFIDARTSTIGKLPSIDGPRAMLRAGLARIHASSAATLRERVQGMLATGRLATVALGLITLFLLGGLVRVGILQMRAPMVPDSSRTPGATRVVTLQEVCSERTKTDFYPIPATLANRVFETYQIHNPKPRSYEVDYLITPALGGADDVRNLWPQPYASGEWNAHVKDALEDYLHSQVCEGKLDLATAQQDISKDWIAAYRKYFRTMQPLQDHMAFSADPPWEN